MTINEKDVRQRSSFDLCTNHLTRLADEWDETPTPFSVESLPGSREAFEHMATKLFGAVVAIKGIDRFKSGVVQHGTEVIARLLYMYALVAKEHLMDTTAYSLAVHEPGTFESFEPIAHGMSDRLAGRVEHRLQLCPSRYADDLTILKWYGYDSEKRCFSIPGLPVIAAEQKLDIIRESIGYIPAEQISEEVTGHCMAHKANALQSIFTEMSAIVIKDSRLVPALLE